MQKRVKKITLHRETLRHLTPSDLRVARGEGPGFSVNFCPTLSCHSICDPCGTTTTTAA